MAIGTIRNFEHPIFHRLSERFGDRQLTIDVAMSIAVDEAGNPEEIEALRFRNSDFQYVTLYPPDMYK